jgi:very-long-chain enoyl-CoA reductase
VNFYHHYLLASLRSDDSCSGGKYHPPKGGLFEYVAAPHYLFELIAWAGIAIASQHLTGYLNLLSMSGYLFARSQNQNNWNRKKFDEKEWPKSRKNLIPFLY